MLACRVVQLNDACRIEPEVIGPKASSLLHLSRIGLTVPPGFCVTAQAYCHHLKVHNLIPRITSTLSSAGNVLSADLKDLRESIIQARLDTELTELIARHYAQLDGDSVAVRSSATAEDLGDHSFAGQYDTYLGIEKLEDCLEAILKCWASLWTERAYEYRQKNDFDHFAVNMAVIVQSLVEADASGVIFTADPVNGYKSRIIIEAVGGLGDSLVSGKATPQRFVVARKKCRIVSKNLTSESCITDSVVKKLSKLGKKIEKHFDSPQDIEWAISGNKIFFLQSRPITVIPLQKSWEDRQVWTNGNTGEVVPDVVTPVTWSVMQTILEPLFGSVFDLLCVESGDNSIVGLVAGRIYFNINTCIGGMRHLPRWRRIDFTAALGGEHGKMYELGQLDVPDEDIPDISGSFVKMMLKLPVALLRIFSYRPKKSQALLDKMAGRNKQLRSLDISAMPEEELVDRLTAIVTEDIYTWDLMYLLSAILPLPFFYLICSKWLKDNDLCIANRLLSGLGGMDDANAGLDLWRLAQKAHEDAETEKVILGSDEWRIARAKISEIEEGYKFLQMWDAFMTQHGHHCRGELELLNRRWFERPDYILSLIRNYLNSIEQLDAVENFKKLAMEREQLAEHCRQRLKNPIKRCLFNYCLQRAQTGSVLRENFKSEVVRQLMVLRKMLVELGQRLDKRGIIENADDIFFLRFEEIKPVTQSKADFDIKKTVASRRQEYEKNISVTPPNVVFGKFNPDDYTPDAVDTNAEILNGLAVSSGVVTGKARVILKADTDEQVLPGEILVAPFTDPGWTPYFIPAAAIVMDIGGMLSHGSIIAREYGIPAVVNVGPATKIIKTGQTIQVDADRGIVRILD